MRLEVIGIGEALMPSDRTVDHVPEIGAGLVGAALFEDMAGKASLGLRLAVGGIGLGEEGAQGFRGRRFATAGLAVAGFGHLDDKARLSREFGVIDDVLDLAQPEHQKRHSEERTRIFIEYETVHIW